MTDEEKGVAFWVVIGGVSLIGGAICVVAGRGSEAIACAIVFSASLWAFKNEL